MRPIDVLTGHTLAFVGEALGAASGLRVLEVGAGSGHLARALQDRGHDVVALDASEKAVARARALGVDARHADWHGFEDGSFDAILFVRSLHHIDRLAAAADRCWPMLRRGGRILLEEFARAEADEAAVRWLQATARSHAESGELDPESGFLGELVAAGDPLAAWRDHHGHMHDIGAMRAAFEHGGRVTAAASTPYLYRYFLGAVTDDQAGAELIQGHLAAESALIAAGRIGATGRRLVIEAQP